MLIASISLCRINASLKSGVGFVPSEIFLPKSIHICATLKDGVLNVASGAVIKVFGISITDNP